MHPNDTHRAARAQSEALPQCAHREPPIPPVPDDDPDEPGREPPLPPDSPYPGHPQRDPPVAPPGKPAEPPPEIIAMRSRGRAGAESRAPARRSYAIALLIAGVGLTAAPVAAQEATLTDVEIWGR